MAQEQKTRIVYVNHTGQISGAERVLVDILQGLDRTRYEPYVICPADGGLSRLVRPLGVACVSAPSLQARFTWQPSRLIQYAKSFGRMILAIRKTIITIDPEFIHANTLRAGIASTLATIGSRRTVIWHIHDILPRHPLTFGVRILAYVSKRTRIITVSHSAARAFCGSFSFKNRIQTIYNGTDLRKFPIKRPGSSQFRREVGIPEDAFMVCSVGQICERKGLRELITAFSAICGKVPHMHLALVGRVVFPHEQKYRSTLSMMAVASGMSGRIHFTGERHDISAVLQAADLLVLNSFEEPFGLVLVEAMASGTPVLATRVGGIPEIVRDSENGWLIESKDTSGLAAKLLELSQDREMLDQTALFAHDFTCPQFSLQRFQNSVNMLYLEVVSRTEIAMNRGNQSMQAKFSQRQGGSHA